MRGGRWSGGERKQRGGSRERGRMREDLKGGKKKRGRELREREVGGKKYSTKV